MLQQQITIRVTPEAADVYASASAQERRKLDALLSLRLTEARQADRPIEDIMREASAEARERGLTQDILSEILSRE